MKPRASNDRLVPPALGSTTPTSAYERVGSDPLAFLSDAARQALEDLVAQKVREVLADAADAGEIEPPSPYMSIPEAASFLRCERQRVYDLLSRRTFERFKDGSRTLLLRAEVESYVERSNRSERGT